MSEDAKKNLLDCLGMLDLYMKKGYWAAGESLSLPDFFLAAVIENIVQFGANLAPYPNIQDWYKRVQTLPGYDENQEGGKQFADWIRSKLTEEITWPC